MDGRANPLMDPKVVGAVLFVVVAVATSPTTVECSVLWCGIVFSCSCSGTCSVAAAAAAAVAVFVAVVLFNAVAVVVEVVV